MCTARHDALDAFARQHQAFLLGFARKLCGPIDDAADLVQDVLEKAVTAPERIPPGGNARNWLARVMRNTFIDQLRRHVAAPRTVAIDDALPARAIDEPPWWSRLGADDVRAMLVRLPADQREAFELYAFEQRSYQEIAARLGVPSATVGTRILRARRRLRELFADT